MHPLQVPQDESDPRVGRLLELRQELDQLLHGWERQGHTHRQNVAIMGCAREAAPILVSLFDELRPGLRTQRREVEVPSGTTAEQMERVRGLVESGRKIKHVCHEMGLDYEVTYRWLCGARQGRGNRHAPRVPDADVAEMRRLYFTEGLPTREIAARFGRGHNQTHSAINGLGRYDDSGKK